jgi:hypothetical protein
MRFLDQLRLYWGCSSALNLFVNICAEIAVNKRYYMQFKETNMMLKAIKLKVMDNKVWNPELKIWTTAA